MLLIQVGFVCGETSAVTLLNLKQPVMTQIDCSLLLPLKANSTVANSVESHILLIMQSLKATEREAKKFCIDT